MKFARTGYGLKGQAGQCPAWVNGWNRTSGTWQLEAIRRARDGWIADRVPADRALMARAFEPSTPGLNVLGTENRRFEISNLSALSPLLEPRELLGRMLPGAPVTDDHAIYVAKTGDGRLYFPALLLIERLWLWSSAALRAILTPNSLDVFVGRVAETDDGAEIAVDPQLASRTPTELALHRIAWLALSSEARASWSSVLTSANNGRIDLRLPTARLSGWAWGAELASGFLACELSSLALEFDLPRAQLRIRIGSAVHQLPVKSTSDDGSLVKQSEYEDRDEENADTVMRRILDSKPLGWQSGRRKS